jgi:hypothetical protein
MLSARQQQVLAKRVNNAKKAGLLCQQIHGSKFVYKTGDGTTE